MVAKPMESTGANTIQYKGYIGAVEYDDEAGIFHGEVLNLRDVITFEGQCVEELRQALADSVEDYLAFCKERGEEPEKPFSGQFLVRVGPELHREIYARAKRSNKSVNLWVKETLERAVS